jgi:beta-phosphoglucomutase-like phosphatase (HAD superfamily)
MPPRAVLFDFNGTLSDDEPILYAVYAELFAERGRPLSRDDYLDQLAGLSEEDIFATWLGAGHPGLDRLVAERVSRYRARVVDGSTVSPSARAAVRYAAARVPVGIVSGAAREEIEPVVRAAGLAGAVAFVVSADDVAAGKPHPEGYLRALELIGGDVRAPDVAVFEDTEAGVSSAKAAGMLVIALTRTLGPARLARADALVGAIEPAVMERLFAAGYALKPTDRSP